MGTHKYRAQNIALSYRNTSKINHTKLVLLKLSHAKEYLELC